MPPPRYSRNAMRAFSSPLNQSTNLEAERYNLAVTKHNEAQKDKAAATARQQQQDAQKNWVAEENLNIRRQLAFIQALKATGDIEEQERKRAVEIMDQKKRIDAENAATVLTMEVATLDMADPNLPIKVMDLRRKYSTAFSLEDVRQMFTALDKRIAEDKLQKFYDEARAVLGPKDFDLHGGNVKSLRKAVSHAQQAVASTVPPNASASYDVAGVRVTQGGEKIDLNGLTKDQQSEVGDAANSFRTKLEGMVAGKVPISPEMQRDVNRIQDLMQQGDRGAYQSAIEQTVTEFTNQSADAQRTKSAANDAAAKVRAALAMQEIKEITRKLGRLDPTDKDDAAKAATLKPKLDQLKREATQGSNVRGAGRLDWLAPKGQAQELRTQSAPTSGFGVDRTGGIKPVEERPYRSIAPGMKPQAAAESVTSAAPSVSTSPDDQFTAVNTALDNFKPFADKSFWDDIDKMEASSSDIDKKIAASVRQKATVAYESAQDKFHEMTAPYLDEPTRMKINEAMVSGTPVTVLVEQGKLVPSTLDQYGKRVPLIPVLAPPPEPEPDTINQ